MKVSLVVQTAGKASGQAIPVPSAQFIIGRDPQCNLRPASAMISKRHCAVLVKEGRVFLRDFDSTNGTFLNDEPVKGEVPLKDGDMLKVGPLLFKVAIEGAPVPAATKRTPAPQPKKGEVMDDDAAALLLDLGEDEGASVAASETADAVPEGTTIMEMPALQAALDQATKDKAAAGDKTAEGKMAESKPAEKPKGPEPKKHAQGAAQDAAKAILEKLRAGGRKK